MTHPLSLKGVTKNHFYFTATCPTLNMLKIVIILLLTMQVNAGGTNYPPTKSSGYTNQQYQNYPSQSYYPSQPYQNYPSQSYYPSQQYQNYPSSQQGYYPSQQYQNYPSQQGYYPSQQYQNYPQQNYNQNQNYPQQNYQNYPNQYSQQGTGYQNSQYPQNPQQQFYYPQSTGYYTPNSNVGHNSYQGGSGGYS